jgi:beta-glucosidase
MTALDAPRIRRRGSLRNFRRIAALAVAATALTPMLAPVARAQTAKADKPLYKDAGQPIDARVEDLLGRMTLEEKVSQLVAIWLNKGAIQTPSGDFDPAKASKSFPNGLGMISRPSDRKGVDAGTANAGADLSVNRSAVDTATYINAAQKWAMERTRLGIPMIMHEEALHGLVAPGATSFPQSIALASSWDPALLEKIFSVAASEARARGANLVLAPVVDVARDPRWGRIEETYGEDPYLVSEMGLAAIRGFQGTTLPLAKDKVFVTLKHMTGHGQPENGTNVGPASLGERTLREDFFPPFEKAVTQLPVRAVMASYNEIDGIPSHANKWLLHDVLRGEWGFKGAVVSDYFAIRELVTRHHMFKTGKEAGARAIDAGVDVETPDGEGFNFLIELVREGKVSQGQIDNAVRRVLEMKFEGGLFENPYADVKTAAKKTNTPEAIALARQAARESVVLLKNSNGLLPLDAAGIKRMMVIGTHAKDTPIGGYSDVPNHVVSVLEAMQAEGKGKFQVDYSEGVRLTEGHVWAQDDVKLTDAATNDKLRADAVAAAKDADVIVMVLGGNEALSREAWADNHLGDSESLDLPGPQDQLAKEIFALGKPVVVILLNGRPYAVNYLAEKAPALIEGWYLGEQTGNALADVVFGRFNPGGKLPVSVARNVGQLPIYYNKKPSARRGYLFGDTTPLYPFGYGLSYTSFEVGKPVLGSATIGVAGKVNVNVDVTNTGKRAGDEVVQLYVHDDEASVTRPVIELKRFQRVMLQPGEKKTVSFELTPADLSLWNVDMKRVVEPGTFTISAGSNSVDLKSSVLTVE